MLRAHMTNGRICKLICFFLIILVKKSETVKETNNTRNGDSDRLKTVKTSLPIGIVEGFQAIEGSVVADVYNAVPYAQPPVKHLRFENPLPLPLNRTRIIDSDKLISCPEMFAESFTGEIKTEDCLYMKIVVPHQSSKRSKKERLPAVFWIHGGSYSAGSKDMFLTKNVIKYFTSQDIIFIAPNYRLSIFGFMSFKDVYFPGNYGLEDTLLALKFVHENAELFGIDRNQITVAGESAGASMASILATSPRSRGLVSSVLMLSGSSQATWAVRTNTTVLSSMKFAAKCGCEKQTVIEIKSCMKNLSNLTCFNDVFIEFLQEVRYSWYEALRMGGTMLTPVVDDFRESESIIPHEADIMVSENSRVPALITVAANELENSKIIENLKIYSGIEEPNKDFKKLSKMIDSLISWNVKSRKYVIQLLRKRYITSNLTLNSSTTTLEIANLLTRDMISSSYHEALLYAMSSQRVYALETIVHEKEPTVHGHDTGCLFGSDNFHSGCSECALNEDFAKQFSKILTEFIKTRQLNNILPFTGINRIAYEVRGNGTKPIDWHTEDYYFWKQSIPLLESLVIY